MNFVRYFLVMAAPLWFLNYNSDKHCMCFRRLQNEMTERIIWVDRVVSLFFPKPLGMLVIAPFFLFSCIFYIPYVLKEYPPPNKKKNSKGNVLLGARRNLGDDP
jgi:hypothetical protein